ncbi:hypothetical protein VR44_32600, partial [Streptomyces katrae]
FSTSTRRGPSAVGTSVMPANAKPCGAKSEVVTVGGVRPATGGPCPAVPAPATSAAPVAPA